MVSVQIIAINTSVTDTFDVCVLFTYFIFTFFI